MKFWKENPSRSFDFLSIRIFISLIYTLWRLFLPFLSSRAQSTEFAIEVDGVWTSYPDRR